MTRQEVEGKKFTAAVTFFGGYLYGEYKGGRYRDSQTRELMDRVWGDYERRKMEYEAKAREVIINLNLIA